MAKFKSIISEASQTDFDDMSEKPLNPAEMEQSMLGIASDVKPTKDGLGPSKDNKKYSINPESGEKSRLGENAPRRSSGSKNDRKKERSLAFWDRL
jgi:hypothetical protein